MKLIFSMKKIYSDGKIITTTDDVAGWKSMLKVPPKDNRIKTSVSYTFWFIFLSCIILKIVF